jgi:hypothetical protein
MVPRRLLTFKGRPVSGVCNILLGRVFKFIIYYKMNPSSSNADASTGHKVDEYDLGDFENFGLDLPLPIPRQNECVYCNASVLGGSSSHSSITGSNTNKYKIDKLTEILNDKIITVVGKSHIIDKIKMSLLNNGRNFTIEELNKATIRAMKICQDDPLPIITALKCIILFIDPNPAVLTTVEGIVNSGTLSSSSS